MNYYIITNDATKQNGVAGNQVTDVLEKIVDGGTLYVKVATLSSRGDEVVCTVPFTLLTVNPS